MLSVSGGSISYSTAPNTGGVYASGTVAIYTCDPSRMLVGLFPTRTCIATPGDNPMGTWSDTSPSCDGKNLIPYMHCNYVQDKAEVIIRMCIAS